MSGARREEYALTCGIRFYGHCGHAGVWPGTSNVASLPQCGARYFRPAADVKDVNRTDPKRGGGPAISDSADAEWRRGATDDPGGSAYLTVPRHDRHPDATPPARWRGYARTAPSRGGAV